MSVKVQFDFRPIPGKSLLTVLEMAKIAAALWKKHGAAPRLWNVSVGEVGAFAFSMEFANFSDYGRCMDAVYTDPEFRAWQAKVIESGASEWVRANLMREIPQ